jgi:hypothetical protein
VVLLEHWFRADLVHRGTLRPNMPFKLPAHPVTVLARGVTRLALALWRGGPRQTPAAAYRRR